jgi:hypothetical protein
MIDRVEERFGIKPRHLIGDTAYGNASTLGWLVDEKKIDPHIPVWTRADPGGGLLRAATLSGTRKPMSTAARKAMRCDESDAPSRFRARTSPRPTQSFTERARPIAPDAHEESLLSGHADAQDRPQRARGSARGRP